MNRELPPIEPQAVTPTETVQMDFTTPAIGAVASRKNSGRSEKPDSTPRPVELIKSATITLAGMGDRIRNRVSGAGKGVLRTSTHVAGTIAHTAVKVGSSVFKLAQGAGTTAVKQTHYLVEHATEGTGQAVSFVSDSPLIRKLTGALQLNWLVDLSDRVDLVKAETVVRQLQQAHPDDSPSQIAHRLMVEKALYAGGVGLASRLVPGGAIGLLAVDLATTTALQTEMLYQIAAAYGLDLKDPARKGEAVAIFGLALGGNRAVRAGLAFVKTVPLAGALISASANATMLYALGYAACRFYEAKLNPDVSETAPATLEDMHQKSENYLEVAMAQQKVMDQILAKMLLASYPEKSWETILPDLRSLGLHPSSLQAIGEHLRAPQPLGALLDQLNRDFAVLTLSRCNAIAHLDNRTNSEETKVLEAIRQRFDLDLQEVEADLTGDVESVRGQVANVD